MFFKSISLIIDDKANDGNFIAAYLNRNFVPNIFYCYDSDKDWSGFEAKISGIRTIFQDLSLISSSSPTTTDFDAAAETIENILDENNGPWLLITWSTWAESESETDFPRQLFEHLQQELPASLRPFDYITINKSLFTPGHDHNPVSTPNDSSLAQLHEIIEGKISQRHGLKYLIGWEQTVKKAVHSALGELTNIASGHEQSNEVLHKILENIAASATGKSSCTAALNAGTSETLSDIIKDKIENQIPNNINDFERVMQSASDNRDLDMTGLSSWKESINRAIHFDMSEKVKQYHKPGNIYNINERVINSGIKSFPDNIQDVNTLSKFKRKNFFCFLDNERSVRREVSERSDLICLDITPPCDHANNKAEWSKYIVGIILKNDDDKFCRLVKSINTDNGLVRVREDDGIRLINDSLILLPRYAHDDGSDNVYRVVLNAKLTFSIPVCSCDEALGELQLMRARENILSDIRSWFIRQATRPGIVELRG